MAHKIYQKDSNTWKKIKKGWVKESNNWKKIKKGWVKESNEWKLFFSGGFPKGIILPYNSSAAVPSGWSEYTAPYGRLIIGADSQYPAKQSGGQASTTYTGAVSNAGSHGGTPSVWNAYWNGDGDCAICTKFDGDAHQGYVTGGHIHSSITGTVSTKPASTELRLIKAIDDPGGLPSRVAIMSAVSLIGAEGAPADMSEFSAGGTFLGRYFAADSNASATDGAATATQLVGTTSSAGLHHHGGVNRTLRSGTNGYYAIHKGQHTHQGYIKGDNTKYSYYYLSMWQSASDVIDASPNMIGMWEGTTAPEGWAICNGSNGTPDLRNRFIKFANSTNRNSLGGSMQIGLSTFTNNSVAHNHTPPAANSLANTSGPSMNIKHSSNEYHSHQSTSVNRNLVPQYYSLSFIMKLPD